MCSAVRRRSLLIAVGLAALAVPAPAVSATVTLHVENNSRLPLGANTNGVPFFLGVYGVAPRLFGTLTSAAQPIASAIVEVQFRATRNFAATPWKRVCEAVTDADGVFVVKPGDCASGGLGAWYPPSNGALRAVATSPVQATSRPIGWLVVPDIQITRSTRSTNTYGPVSYHITGRLTASSKAVGTIELTQLEDGAVIGRRSVRGGMTFAFAVTLTRSGTKRLRLDFVPRTASDDSQPTERDLALQVSIRYPPSTSTSHPRQTTVISRPAAHPRAPQARLPDIPL